MRGEGSTSERHRARARPEAPLIRCCRTTFSPSPRGEGTSMRIHQSAAVRSCDSASFPFAPRSGEKVVRQPRMRGRGRWGAIDVAAVRTRRFIGCCRRRSTKAPLIRGCRTTFSPSPRGEGIASVFSELQLAFLRQRQLSLRPAPRGEGTASVFSEVQPCIPATAPAFPSPRASGEKVVRQHRMRVRGRWGGIAVARKPSPTPVHAALPHRSGTIAPR